MLEPLLQKVRNREEVIGVLGLGRVGLPLASVFASSGVKSIGIDNNFFLTISSGKRKRTIKQYRKLVDNPFTYLFIMINNIQEKGLVFFLNSFYKPAKDIYSVIFIFHFY